MNEAEGKLDEGLQPKPSEESGRQCQVRPGGQVG